MDKTIVWYLYRSLRKKERESFRAILEVTVEQKDDIWIVLEALDKNLSRKWVLAQLQIASPDKNADSHVRQLSLKMKTQLELFLSKKELEKNAIIRGRVTLLQLLKRKLEKPFLFFIEHFGKTYLRKLPRGEEFYRHEYELATLATEVGLNQNKGLKGYDLHHASRAFELSYLHGGFILLFAYVIRRKLGFSEGKVPVSLDRDVLISISQAYPEERFFTHIRELIPAIEEDRLQYSIHIAPFIEEIKDFPPEQVHNLINGMLTYLIHAGNKSGDTLFYDQLSQIYDIALSQNLLHEKNRLSVKHYSNAIISHLKVGNPKRSWDILEAQKRFLDKRSGAESYRICKAMILFSENDFVAAQALLDSESFLIVNYRYQAKHLLKLIQYELSGDCEEKLNMIGGLRALEGSVRYSKEVSQNVSRTIMRRIFFLKKLIEYEYDYETAGQDGKLYDLMTEIKEAEFVADQTWLMEKIEAILGKKESNLS